MSELVFPHSIDAGTAMVANEVQSNFDAVSDVVNGQLQGGSGSDGNLAANGVTARELHDSLHIAGSPGVVGPLQEGVYAAGDGKVTPGAGLVLNYAAGNAWIVDDSGVIAASALLPAVWSGSTVTITANSSGNPRIDQIILTMTDYRTGTVSILPGTATAGADLDDRLGAAALPSNAIRLADILMPNGFAGPFVQTTHIRDRRPWARGAAYRANVAGLSTASTSYVNLTGAGPFRLETSANEVRVQLTGSHNTDERVSPLQLLVDGAQWPDVARSEQYFYTSPVAAPFEAATEWAGALAAGSHTFEVQIRTVDATRGHGFTDGFLSIQEVLRQNIDNSGA